MIKKIYLFIAIKFICFFLFFSSFSSAAIVVTGTRVIYYSNEKEVTVKVKNKGELPVLIQTWVDDGDVHVPANHSKAPFIITPPIYRVDPQQGQNLRITYIATKALPNDRESVYWLNILEIPPKVANSEERNQLTVAFRTRIKLFYRPSHLTRDNKLATKLEWKKTESGVSAYNPSPYFVSISHFSTDEKGSKVVGEGGMIAPFSHHIYPLTKPFDTLYFHYINDFGGEMTARAKIVH